MTWLTRLFKESFSQLPPGILHHGLPDVKDVKPATTKEEEDKKRKDEERKKKVRVPVNLKYCRGPRLLIKKTDQLAQWSRDSRPLSSAVENRVKCSSETQSFLGLVPEGFGSPSAAHRDVVTS